MSTLSPPDLLRTVYVGDRACKGIHIERWRTQVTLEVSLISRIRSASGNWDYYSAEDIPDGKIVFTGVESIQLDPPGSFPNDFIHELKATPVGVGRWSFEASIGSVAPDGSSTEVTVRIIGSGLHLEDPRRPGVQIRE